MCSCGRSSATVATPDQVVAATTPAEVDAARREQQVKSQEAALRNARS